MARKSRYQQLVDQIIQDYCTQLAPGDLLPGLPELCRKYNTSEITIKKTMSLLAEHGIVKRIPGKGTVVLDSPALKNPFQVFIPQYELKIRTLEHWSFSDYLEEQAAKYSKINPEISITISRTQNDPGEYDLIAVNESHWVRSQTESLRSLESIRGLNFNPDSFVPGILDFCRRDDGVYMLPLGFSPLVCIYNLDRPEIKQIDWQNLQTFDQFTQAMLKVKNDRLKYPFFCMSVETGIWGHFIHSYRGGIDKLCEPEAQRGLRVMYDMLHEHHICPIVNDYTFHWNLFNTGRFIVTWGKYGRIRTNPQMRLGIAPLPYGEVKNGSLFMEGLVVPKSSRKIPQIRDFLNFLLGSDAQLDLCASTDGLCTQKIIADYCLEKKHKRTVGAKHLLNELKNVRIVPDTPELCESIRHIIVPLQLLTLGVYEPAEFCSEVTRLLAENKN